MTSSGQDPSEINSAGTSTNTRSADILLRCTYPNERREKNQIYTLLSISNSINEEEERFPECANETGWEDAVQGWSKTPPFAYLQVQKRARKTKASESVNGCLYCADLMQGIDKGLEQDARTVEQLRSEFRLSTYIATDSIPGKSQTLLCSSTTANTSATDEIKKEGPCGKICSSQTYQEEKKKMTLKEAEASLSERKFFVMKESPLFPAEKKTVPIKEYSILPPGQPKNLETLKCRDIRSHEPSSTSGPTVSETAAAAAKSSLVLPPVKDAAPKNTLDPPSRKRQTTVSQASEKALSDPTSYMRAFKAREPNWEKGSNTVYDALKEQIKMHEIASFVPRLSKTSFLSRNLDQCYWPCSLFPDKKPGAVSNSIALRRHSHPNSVHFLHTKATAQVSKANGIPDHFIRSRSHTGTKQPRESKVPAEIPLLSGLFPSLTEEGWGRATPFTCCKIPPKAKKPKITKAVSSISHRQRRAGLKKNMSRVAHPGRGHRKKDQIFTKKETISSNKEDSVSSIKHYNFVPVMTTKAEGEKRTGKLDSIQTFLGEKRTLPIKEYEIKYSQPPPGPQVFRYKEISLPKVIRDPPPSSLSCITLNAFLVFRADERGIINLHLEPLSNSKATAVLRAEKEDSTSAETEPHSRTCTTKKMKQKNEKKAGRTNPRKKQIQKSCYHPWTGL